MQTVPILYTCRSFLSLILVLSWYSHPVFLVGAATSTIDDAESAFTFASAWNAITPSDPCDGCSSKLDSTQVLDGTWHDGSVAGSTASLKFEGSGVALYGVTNADQTCALTFVLDGGNPVNLDLSAIPQTPTNVYNYQFFSASGLSSGSHTLSWTIESSVSNAVALIDYAIITSDVASSSTTTISKTTSTSSSTAVSSASNNGHTVTVIQTGVTSSISSDSKEPSSVTPSNPTSGTSSNILSSPVNDFSTSTTPTTVTTPFSSTPSSSNILITIGTSVETSIISPAPTGSVSTGSAVFASQKSKTAAIIGAVLGSVLGVALIVIAVFLLSRRRRRSKAPSSMRGLDTFRFDHTLDRPLSPEKETLGRTNFVNSDSATTPSPSGDTAVQSVLQVENSGEIRTPELQASQSAATNSETPGEPMRQMEQRIFLLEQLLRQSDQAEFAIHDTSPPPY